MVDDVEVRRRTTLELAASYQALLSAGRWDEWIELWSEQPICEFPYAATGRPARLEGRPAILTYMRGAGGRFAIDATDELVLHEGADGSTLVVELAIRGHVIETGAPYDQRYVSIFEVIDGRLARYREYWNPLLARAAFDQEPAP